MSKQKIIISKIWEGKELCKNLGYVFNKEGIKTAIELYKSKGHTITNLMQIDKLAMVHFDKEYPLAKNVNNETINKHSNAEYFFMMGIRWAVHHLTNLDKL